MAKDSKQQLRISPERVKVLLYLLMRSEMPTGRLFERLQETSHITADNLPHFSSEILASYAEQLIARFLVEAADGD